MVPGFILEKHFPIFLYSFIIPNCFFFLRKIVKFGKIFAKILKILMKLNKTSIDNGVEKEQIALLAPISTTQIPDILQAIVVSVGLKI